MKKIIYIAAILLGSTFAVSCDLDTPPYSDIPEGDFFTTPEEVNAGVLGCYSQLHGVMYYEWAVTELRSDNTRMFGNNSSSVTSQFIEQLDQATILTTHNWVNNYWEACYTEILSCNKVIESLSVVTDLKERAQYEAEAKFLRALMHFNLMRLWGPVFLMDRTVSAPQARDMMRSSTDDLYALVEGDLENIVNNAMLPASYPAKSLGRVTLTAAKALLAKVYMTHYGVGEGAYGTARLLLEEVLTAVGNPATYKDLVPYAEIFDVNNEMNAEILFAVRYQSGTGLGSPFASMFAPTNSGASVVVGSGTSYNFPSNNIINTFKIETADVRKDISLAETYVNKITGATVTSTSRYVKKYMSEMTQRYDGQNDWPVIRVGDVILLLAETINETEGPANALKYLNMTRQRAKLDPLTETQLPDAAAFRIAVRTERRLELAFENQRWFDLLRWGVAAETVSAYMATETFYGGYNYSVGPIGYDQCMLPIPQAVMNVNPKIPQNPGY